MKRTSNPQLISDPRQVRALASVARQEIVDLLEGEGPCTVRQLAELLERPADALYYHIRVLLKAGLLREVTNDAGHLMLDVAFRPMRLSYEPADSKRRKAVLNVVKTFLRSSERSFARAFRPGVAVVEGEHRNLWAGRARGRLSPDELRAVNAHINEISRILRGSRNGSDDARGAAHEFTFVLNPIVKAARKRSTR